MCVLTTVCVDYCEISRVPRNKLETNRIWGGKMPSTRSGVKGQRPLFAATGTASTAIRKLLNSARGVRLCAAYKRHLAPLVREFAAVWFGDLWAGWPSTMSSSKSIRRLLSRLGAISNPCRTRTTTSHPTSWCVYTSAKWPGARW